MSVNTNRQPAGTPNGGQFAAGSTGETGLDLQAQSDAESAYARAEVFERQVEEAKRQIAELSAQADRDSALQLGFFIRAVAPDATHARLEWDEYRWRLDKALDADGNELDIDDDSQQWWDCEDGIDVATGQMSQGIFDRSAISFGHDDSISNGATTTVGLN